MQEFIRLIDDGYKVSIYKEGLCYIFLFSKGRSTVKLVKYGDAFKFMDPALILDDLARHARDVL